MIRSLLAIALCCLTFALPARASERVEAPTSYNEIAGIVAQVSKVFTPMGNGDTHTRIKQLRKANWLQEMLDFNDLEEHYRKHPTPEALNRLDHFTPTDDPKVILAGLADLADVLNDLSKEPGFEDRLRKAGFTTHSYGGLVSLLQALLDEPRDQAIQSIKQVMQQQV